MKEIHFDDRRTLILPGDKKKTLEYCIHSWIKIAKEAIHKHGFFTVALSGGSTPKAIYQGLSLAKEAKEIDWKKVFLFWSDERAVPPTHPDSNFFMAMVEGGLEKLGIPDGNIFRMHAEENLEENARKYELKIHKILGGRPFDLIMLGVGEDGHTASLFPNTAGLSIDDQEVIANYIPTKKVWRMSFTFRRINRSKNIQLYLIGPSKADIVSKLFSSPSDALAYPSQFVGTAEHKASWILDDEASSQILALLK